MKIFAIIAAMFALVALSGRKEVIFIAPDWDVRQHPDMARNIQALIDEATVRGDGIVYLPAGVFEIQRPIYAPPGTALMGAGANRLEKHGDGNGPMLSIPVMDHVTLDGMVFVSNGSGAVIEGPSL